MTRGILRTVIPWLVISAASCGTPSFPNQDTLSSLRIIALIADKPEANAGDTVTITPILSDIAGNGRALSYSVTGCVDPGFSFGQDQSCVGQPGALAISPAGTAVAPGTANYAGVAGYSSPNYTGSAASFSFALPAAAVAFAANNGQPLPAYEQYNGASYLLDYRLTASDGTTVRAVKRVLVSTRPQKNVNPTLTSFTQPDGTTLAALPGAAEYLSPVFGVGTLQYQVELTDGSFTTIGDSLNVSWYASNGSFSLNGTQGTISNQFTPPSPPPTTHQTVILGVVVDGRGGEGALMLAF